jgi:hypothetical protein
MMHDPGHKPGFFHERNFWKLAALTDWYAAQFLCGTKAHSPCGQFGHTEFYSLHAAFQDEEPAKFASVAG